MFAGGNQGVSWAAVISGFQAHVVVGRILFLVGRGTEGLSPSLVVDRELPSAPCHMGLASSLLHQSAQAEKAMES